MVVTVARLTNSTTVTIENGGLSDFYPRSFNIPSQQQKSLKIKDKIKAPSTTISKPLPIQWWVRSLNLSKSLVQVIN